MNVKSINYSHPPIFEEFSELARVLGSVHRIILLQHIMHCERSVDRLSTLASMTVANTSQHLQQLKRAGFIQSRRDGKKVLYRLGDGPISELLSDLSNLAEFRHSNATHLIQDTVTQQAQIEELSREELVNRMKEGSVILLDVRPREEFEYGHLADAINIPIDELEARLVELPKEQEILAYCRAPYCVLSTEAVKLMRENGLKAMRVKDGFGYNQQDILKSRGKK